MAKSKSNPPASNPSNTGTGSKTYSRKPVDPPPTASPTKPAAAPAFTFSTPAPAAPSKPSAFAPSKPVVVQPTPTAPAKVTREQIAKRAYEIWITKGRPIGRDVENWQQAERELLK